MESKDITKIMSGSLLGEYGHWRWPILPLVYQVSEDKTNSTQVTHTDEY